MPTLDPPRRARRRLSRRRGLGALLLGAAVMVGLSANAAPASAGQARAEATPAASTSAAQLPSWAIGPFTRYAHNPILGPESAGFDSYAAYNPGVIERDGVFHMLYRGQVASKVSEIGGAVSRDGTHFSRVSQDPVIPNSLPNETSGVEDPRLYELDGTYYSFFTGYDGHNIDINEAVSHDAVHWTQLGPVISDDKDAALVTNPQDVPVRIGGRYVMYYGQSGNGVGLAYSTDLTHWTTGPAVDLKFPSDYAPYELCVGVTDYRATHGGPVQHNIDLFVAGTLMAQGRWYYAISEVEFSGTRLTDELAQLSEPVLTPTAPYEINGQTQHTVFMNSIMFDRGAWRMYYGAGDTVTALATAPLR